jgi:SH3 domain protein
MSGDKPKLSIMSLEDVGFMAILKKVRISIGWTSLLGLTVVCFSLLLSSETLAKTFYVSDTTLEVIFRGGPGTSHRIIAALPPGTRVNLLNKENGWSMVGLPDGRTGWTLERYLSDRPPWRFTAERRAKEKKQLESQISEIESSSRELKEANERLEKQLGAQGKELEVTRQEYDAFRKGAANYIGLQKAHEKLASELPELKAKTAEAQKVHDKLQSSANMRWFLYGAGTLVLGWILGVAMGSRRKRRSSEIHR